MRAVITVASPLKAAGRTAAVAHLGTEFALRGYRTLIIDADPQADLTSHFAAPDLDAARSVASYLPAGTRTLADVLVGHREYDGSPLEDGAASLDTVLIDTDVPFLWIAPSAVRLALFSETTAIAVTRLAAEIESLRERFEFVLIDTPRSQTRLLDAALFASTHLLITAAPHVNREEAVDLTMRRQAAMRRVNRRLGLLGVFCNRVDRHNEEASGYAELSDKYDDAVCRTTVSVCAHTELCRERHLPVHLTAPESRGAQRYRHLADELLDRMGVARRKNKGAHALRNLMPIEGERDPD